MGCAFVEFETKSFYKKQIRVHAADALKCPILGDHKHSHVRTSSYQVTHAETV